MDNYAKLEKAFKTGEKYYLINSVDDEGHKEIILLESELEERHKNLLLGEIIKQYENLPEDLQLKFKERIK